MRSKRLMAMGTSGVLFMAMAGCMAHKSAPPAPVVAATVHEKPGQVVERGVASAAATVLKVDQKDRIVTLKNADGEVFDVVVGPEVKNLPQVKKGDQVVATYYESMAITVKKPGEASPMVEAADTAKTAEPGEKPAAVGARQTTLVATVVGLNRGKGTVTLKGPKGNVVTVAARDPKRLDYVKVGDLIEVVYTEAVAISVETPIKQ